MIAARRKPQRPDPPFARELTLVLERVRLRSRLRAEWLRHLWAREGPQRTAHAAADAVLDDRDAPEAEQDWISTRRPLDKLRTRLAAVEDRLQSVKRSRLTEFERRFGLDPAESDLLQACLAHALDPALGRAFAYLDDHGGRAYVTEPLAARLFGHGRTGPWTPESALYRWQLIHARDAGPGEPAALACDPQVRDWFLGRHTLDASLVGIARIVGVRDPLATWPLQRAIELFQGALRRDHGPTPLRLVLSGPPGSGRRTFAAAVAAGLGLRLLAIDGDAIDESDWATCFLRAQRQAFLDRCALVWQGDGALRRPWPHVVPLFPVQFVVAEPGQAPLALDGAVAHRLELPPINADDRRRLWAEHLDAASGWKPEDLERLANRYRATAGEIAGVARKGVRTAAEAARGVREATRDRLGNLAQRLECPFGWRDLVVADPLRDVLEDMVFEATARGPFWERRGARRLFPQGRGLVALFSGMPGTGKTMAAQVIAARLGLDLYRVDVSAMVSKWVGELAQNFERLLVRAAPLNAVILFDEADTFFSKRTVDVRDAQDKFANIDAGHLMIAIEKYDGIAILATNLKSNVDPAFLRRIRYVVDFPKPDAKERREIWRQVVAGLVTPDIFEPIAPALDHLAANVEATGAQIKYAVLAAAFTAARRREALALPHLLRGLNRELVKEGRSLAGRDQERLLAHAG
jgi:MoxR-like ATPase